MRRTQVYIDFFVLSRADALVSNCNGESTYIANAKLLRDGTCPLRAHTRDLRTRTPARALHVRPARARAQARGSGRTAGVTWSKCARGALARRAPPGDPADAAEKALSSDDADA